ncbi:unnamed protein product [Phyllotreta striolata]|uniref:SMP-30/Gluconolactonase/LRE-like region domain-containing protein n=1 Tax=Phyllotreta striolata TaxID=444603 RepID=A0A9N9TP98_PHYSR|nr:unnamed protein product [Phyllotreta striolata]
MCDDAAGSKNYEFIPITKCPLEYGTRLFYDDCTQSLYFVDMPKATVYKYSLACKKLTKAKIGCEGQLAFMFPVEGSNCKFIAGIGRKIVFVNWDGEVDAVPDFEEILEVDTEPDLCKNMLNGAKIDFCGRLWAGTMGPVDDKGNVAPGKGSLYRISQGCSSKQKCRIGITGGLAFDCKKNKMYFCDTNDPKIFQYDLSKDGTIGNEKMIFDFAKNKLEGKPDGMYVDKKGDLWVCVVFGSALIKIDVCNGSIKEKIDCPTAQVTSVVFGGQKLNEVYITTGKLCVGGKPPEGPAGMTLQIKGLEAGGIKDVRYKE